MVGYNKISELVSIKTFEPVINLQWANNKEESLNLLNSYIITEEIADHFESILESITLRRSPQRLESKGGDIDPGQIKRSFIIRGQYGTGKSYFLVVLSSLMESVYNGNYDELMDKFKNFSNIVYHLKILKENEDKLYIVRINGENEINKDFDDVIQESIIDSFTSEFGEHYFESSYGKALDTLSGYKKDDIWPIIEKNLSELDLDCEELESGLKNKKSEYLNKYKELIQRALKQDINIHKDSLGNFIQEASSYVKTKGYSGILLVVDELSAYLKSSQEDRRINRDLAHLQALAEASSYKRKNDLFFVISMHVDLKNFLDNIMTNEDDINKVTGRFEALNLNFESGNELIKNLIIIDKSKLSSLKSSMPKEFIKLENLDGPDYRDYYPMHPMSLPYLKDITENFAQKERTIFQFIANEIKGKKLKEDIVDSDGSINLIKIDSIFDFFRSEISQKRSDVIPSVNETLKLCENEFEEKVAKAIITAKLTVYGDTPTSSSRLSLEEISQLMLVEEFKIKSVLDKFVENYRSNIVFDELDQKYEFVHVGSSRINLDGLIKKEMDRLNPDNILNKFIKNTPGANIRKEYCVEPKINVTPVERTIKGKDYSITSLMNIKSEKSLSGGHDGTINFIIPKFTENIEDIDSRDFMKILEKSKDNICIAFPKTFNINDANIIRIEALERVLGNKEVQNDDNTTKKVQHEIQRLRRSIEREIKRFASFDNFKFIFKEGEVNLKTETELYKYMLDRYYTKFPNINVERISGRSSTNRLIDNVISKMDVVIPEGSTKEEDKQVRETLVPLGLATLQGYVGGNKVIISKPSSKVDKNSKEIWDIVTSGDYNTKELVTILEGPPYGLKDFIVEIYLSCALYHEDIRIMKEVGYTQNNSKELANIGKGSFKIEKPKDVISTEQLINVKTIWGVMANVMKSRPQEQFKPREKVHIMNLRIELSQYLSEFGKRMKDRYDLFKMYGIEIKEALLLTELIEEVRKNYMPNEFFGDFIAIPEKIYEKDFDESIYELEKLFKNVEELHSNMDKLDKVINRMKMLKANEKVFQGANSLKFEEIEKSYNLYLESSFEMDRLEAIEKQQLDLIEEYNSEIKKVHNEFWKEINQMQEEIKNSKHMTLLNTLEKFNFEGIQTKENASKKLISLRVCNKTLNNEGNKILSMCNCLTPSTTLEVLIDKKADTEGLLGETYQTLDNVISNYVGSIKELNSKDRDGQSFSEYLEEREVGLYRTYQESFHKLLSEFSDLDEDDRENLERLIDPVNEFLKPVVKPPVINRINYSDFNNMIERKIESCGKASMDIDTYIEIIKEAWRENKGEYEEIEL